MHAKIKITKKKHLIEWLRFIQENRPKKMLCKTDKATFDFTRADFLQPSHLTSLACLIEEYKNQGARVYFKTKAGSRASRFLSASKFRKYWDYGSDKNCCFKTNMNNILPIWQCDQARINSFADLAERFYAAHSLPGKDLTPLRLTVVEAMNNIFDHSGSKVGGFVFTQYYENTSSLVISICDFGIGIPKKVNDFLKVEGQKPLKHVDALQKALQLGFTTKSKPNNGGLGLDHILNHVKTTNGEIQIISNKAFFAKGIKQSTWLPDIKDNLSLSFRGTYFFITLKTKHFLPLEQQIDEEMAIL